MSFDDKTNPAKPTITHDPDAYLDYAWDLSAVVPVGDVLIATEFIAPDGVEVTPGVNVGNIAIGWVRIIDQALIGTTVSVTCHFTTVGGRVDDRSLWFRIKER